MRIDPWMYIWRIVLVLWLALWLIVAGQKLARADTIDDLVPLVVQAESSGDPHASDGISYGLMGISKCVYDDYIAEHPKPLVSWETVCYNPIWNRTVGEWYLRRIQKWLPEEYRNDWRYIIFAYNSGIGRLKQHKYVLPKWTLNHPNRIYRAVYRGELPRAPKE